MSHPVTQKLGRKSSEWNMTALVESVSCLREWNIFECHNMSLIMTRCVVVTLLQVQDAVTNCDGMEYVLQIIETYINLIYCIFYYY